VLEAEIKEEAVKRRRRYRIALVALLGLNAFGCAPRTKSLFDHLSGTWDWANAPGSCKDNPHTISFAPDHSSMTLTYRHPIKALETEVSVARYEIRGRGKNSLRTAIVDPPETRRTPAGDLVVWDLVLTGPDEFRWHETHWLDGQMTPLVVRCKP
jgi:hypothetical protein